jgi:hypothetical protein
MEPAPSCGARVFARSQWVVVSITGAAEQASSGAHFQIYGLSLSSPLRWRLLSGNNRDIGRGFAEFPTLASCHKAIERLRRDVYELEVVLKRTGHEWTWQLLDTDTPVVIAGHNYDRKIRCERALQQFVERAVGAPVNTNVMLSAARRWSASSARRRLEFPSQAAERGHGALRS